MEIVAVPVLTDNYVWLLHDSESGDTAAVDPSRCRAGARRGGGEGMAS